VHEAQRVFSVFMLPGFCTLNGKLFRAEALLHLGLGNERICRYPGKPERKTLGFLKTLIFSGL